MFDNTNMKLFDAWPNAIRIFGLRIKQFLTAYNIDFSDILETLSYFMLPPRCVKPLNIVLDLVHLETQCSEASVYKQGFMELRDGYSDYIPVYTDGSRDGDSVACSILYQAAVTV